MAFRIPNATYRLQLNPAFGFKDTLRIVEYLYDLGVSDLYSSPIFRCKKASSHGYDVVDPNELNPELGSVDEFERLGRELEKRGMGIVQDIVPNHMAFDYENRMLMNILENGESSEYFNFFDIEWSHPYESASGKLLAPFLGRLYGECLEDGEIKLKYGNDGFSITYYDVKLPLKLESYTAIITHRLNILKKRLG
ncbi:MAG: alpha-amylase family glycosyl hydrolase, partial [Thermodesulfobacteriota bacterium]